MLTISVGDFKAQFSDILEMIKAGEKIAISFGKSKKIVAYLVPPEQQKKKRKLGQLKSKGKVGEVKKIERLEEIGL
jgi:antitoxin (DNA-binding transcriptional repressor) of toxin-antitoxin stability system